MNKTAYDLGVKTAEVMLEKNAVSMSDILPALEEALAKGTGLGNKARGMHPSNIYPRATGAGLGALAGGATGAYAGDEDNMGTNAHLHQPRRIFHPRAGEPRCPRQRRPADALSRRLPILPGQDQSGVRAGGADGDR